MTDITRDAPRPVLTEGASRISTSASHRFALTDEERSFLASNGYVVRRNVFSPDEVAAIAAECETLVDGLVRERKARRFQAGAYVFDVDRANDTMIKWEGDSDVVHGIEPFAHLSPVLNEFAHDARFIDPMRDFVRHSETALFTEKLNLKRPHHGGINPLHQDYPYWVGVTENANEVATAMLMLDDATLENGCLQVVPGSHTRGAWQTRVDDQDPFRQNEIDMAAYPEAVSVPVELERGAMVMFGSLLVHQSAPNTSALPRRALLFSYQPPGRERMLDVQRRERAERRTRRAAQAAAQAQQ